ncbi:MAG: prepilin peptidase [Planctomycetes bacterium]|nr:prepilin peptidase [Planctomycetota bacterium]
MTDAELSRLLQPLLLVWLACFGACVGSFLNVVVFRLPRRCLSILKPTRSFCPKCRHAIRWYENLPLVSWALILRARCAGCGLPISVRYPLVEGVTSLLFLAVGWIHLDGHALELEAWAKVVIHAGFGSALLCCALIDWDLRVIPDAITVPGVLCGVVALGCAPGLLGASGLLDLEGFAARTVLHLDSAFRWWGIAGALAPVESLADWLGDLSKTTPTTYRSLQGVSAGVFGALVGGVGMWIFSATLSRLLGREAMGFGDVKLTAMIGAFTGWQGVLVTLLIGSVLGSCVGIASLLAGRSEEKGATLGLGSLPLGPFLALGAAAGALGGEQLLRALAL